MIYLCRSDIRSFANLQFHRYPRWKAVPRTIVPRVNHPELRVVEKKTSACEIVSNEISNMRKCAMHRTKRKIAECETTDDTRPTDRSSIFTMKSVILAVSVEELECLATWKEGSSRYLVGRLHHGHASSNEDRYRCFVYEKAGQTVQSNLHRAAMGIGAMDHDVGLQSGPVPEGAAEIYRVAQSGDATCNGLFSPMEGSRTMTLMKGTWVSEYDWFSRERKIFPSNKLSRINLATR